MVVLGFPLGSLISPTMGTWLDFQYQARALSYWVESEYNQAAIDCPQDISAAITLMDSLYSTIQHYES